MTDQIINTLLGLAGWVPAISSSTILALVCFLFGTFYKARLEKGIDAKFDAKLEELRSKLRIDEERFRADLKERDQVIGALRSGALTGAAARYAMLDRKRIEAVEKLWTSVVQLGRFKAAAHFTRTLKMDAVLAAAARGGQEADKLRAFGEMLWTAAGLDKANPPPLSEIERLFIPPATWASFAAYRQVVGYPAAQLAMMKTGVHDDFLADPAPMLEGMKITLPHHSKLIDDLGAGSIGFLVDELEDNLLQLLSASLHHGDLDAAGVEQAANIIRVAREISPDNEIQQIEVPDDLRAFARE